MSHDLGAGEGGGLRGNAKPSPPGEGTDLLPAHLRSIIYLILKDREMS
jgi:hypothetical protein